MEEKLRLRMKVYTDKDGVRWLVACGLAATRGGYLKAYAMRDDTTQMLTLTDAQWNALPFYNFMEDGLATERPAAFAPHLVQL